MVDLSLLFTERLLRILAELIALLDLSLQLLREFPLPSFLVLDRIVVQRGLTGKLLATDDR